MTGIDESGAKRMPLGADPGHDQLRAEGGHHGAVVGAQVQRRNMAA